MDDRIVLSSGDLTLHLHSPHLPGTCRFDRSLQIDEVLFGEHTLCEPEQRLPGRRTTGGRGLCYEWTWPTPQSADGHIEKFGVGTLTGPAGPYSIWQAYSLSPCSVDFEHTKNTYWAIYETAPGAIRARIERRLTVYPRQFIVQTRVTNIGEDPFEALEYGHNFMSIDHLPIGPGYHLQMPFVPSLSVNLKWEFSHLDTAGIPDGETAQMIRQRDSQITFKRPLKDEAMFTAIPRSSMISYPGMNFWCMTHEKNSLSITEFLSETPCQAAIWGVEHVLCAELFQQFSPVPGESIVRQRIYELSA